MSHTPQDVPVSHLRSKQGLGCHLCLQRGGSLGQISILPDGRGAELVHAHLSSSQPCALLPGKSCAVPHFSASGMKAVLGFSPTCRRPLIPSDLLLPWTAWSVLGFSQGDILAFLLHLPFLRLLLPSKDPPLRSCCTIWKLTSPTTCAPPGTPVPSLPFPSPGVSGTQRAFHTYQQIQYMPRSSCHKTGGFFRVILWVWVFWLHV